MLKKTILYLFFLLVLCFVRIEAQSTADGRFSKNTYENSYFKFAYTGPSFLQPYDVNALQLPNKSPAQNEFLLFSMREGEEAYGIVAIAERMHVAAQHAGEIKSASQFMDVIAHFRPEQHVVIKARKQFKNADGISVEELEYTEAGEPSSAILMEFGEFLIVFKCNAKTQSELDAMNQSILAIHRLK